MSWAAFLVRGSRSALWRSGWAGGARGCRAASETEHKPIRFGQKDTKASLLDLAQRMLEVLYRTQQPGTAIVAVEEPFDVPLIDLDTGEVLDRVLIGSPDLMLASARAPGGSARCRGPTPR